MSAIINQAATARSGPWLFFVTGSFQALLHVLHAELDTVRADLVGNDPSANPMVTLVCLFPSLGFRYRFQIDNMTFDHHTVQ